MSKIQRVDRISRLRVAHSLPARPVHTHRWPLTRSVVARRDAEATSVRSSAKLAHVDISIALSRSHFPALFLTVGMRNTARRSYLRIVIKLTISIKDLRACE